jgi:hypothetical protein
MGSAFNAPSRRKVSREFRIIFFAVLFGMEQIAKGGSNIGAHQDGAAGLKDLIVGADADSSEILLGVEAACRGDSLVQDVVDGAQRIGLEEGYPGGRKRCGTV